AGTRAHAPNEKSPSNDRSGRLNTLSGRPGYPRFQPCGFVPWEGPAFTIASTTMASTVDASTPRRIAPRTPLATRIPGMRSPTTKTAVGQDAMDPPMPRPTGTVVLAASGIRRTNPASTNPINVMNNPMPTAIADFNCAGTALNTAVRTPVSTSTQMTIPL